MTLNHPARFLLAWLFPLTVGAAAGVSGGRALGAMVAFMVTLALLERVPAWRHSPAPAPRPTAWHMTALRGHLLWQFALLALGLYAVSSWASGWDQALALGIAIGGVTGSQGITFAHELGHSRSRFDRGMAWLLMCSVNYSHFMVEHYRGHHVRAATHADPATARFGESLWKFLPRSLVGSWRSAWALETQRLLKHQRGWHQSPLLWATMAQALWLLVLFQWLGMLALVFWCLQSAYAVFLLEAINYIEHYGLTRQQIHAVTEPFGVHHAWNADASLTNCFVINLQRHSDHHMHAWKPYATLAALPGPQLPTGYSGALFLAAVPALWFRTMHPRLAKLRTPA